MAKASGPRLLPRLRVIDGETIVLGPGKADLLDAVERLGSLRDAADEIGMSYMRAWRLTKTMNAAFSQPVVVLSRGGTTHGGAELTPLGREALALYRSMEAETLRATRTAWKGLRKLLR
jgi:molybdate transport system regulatory protein